MPTDSTPDENQPPPDPKGGRHGEVKPDPGKTAPRFSDPVEDDQTVEPKGGREGEVKPKK